MNCVFVYVQVNYELYKTNAHFGGGGGGGCSTSSTGGRQYCLTYTHQPLTGDGEGGITEGEGLEKERLEMESVKGFV